MSRDKSFALEKDERFGLCDVQLEVENKQIRNTVALLFDDIQSDDEWITEEGDDIDEI